MPESIVATALTAHPNRLQLEWKMSIEGGVFVFPFDVLQVRLYCKPFPVFDEPRLVYPPLSRVQHTRGVGGSIGGGVLDWQVTREAFRPGSPTEPSGERFGYYPLDLHLAAVHLTTNQGTVSARVEWPVEASWMDADFTCWATFGYIVPTPGPAVGDYVKVAETEAYRYDPDDVPEPATVLSSADAPYVFISYQRDSETEASQIRQYLLKAGFRVWQDVEDIRHSDRWLVAIDQALRDTDRLLLLMTPEAIASQGVFTEWFFYYAKRKPLHCLMLQTCEPNAALLPYQYLDWRDPARRDWERLARELQAEFVTPAVALNERIITTEFAPERSLPDALRELRKTLLSDAGVVDLRSEQLKEIREHNPADVTEFRLMRYAEWCGPKYQLDQRFVKLTMYVDQGSKAQQRFTEHKRFDDLRQVLAEQDQHTLVLLGDPGAGKSTLLRRLEMDTSVNGLRDPQDRTLTLFANLGEYGVGLREDQLPSPFDWLSAHWASRYPHLPELDTLLHERRMLLLLDSLNEMPHTDQDDYRRRADLWRAFVYTYVRDRPGNRAVFACRTLNYGAVLSTDENPVPQIQLERMTPALIRDYLEHYAPEHADMIWQSFQDDRRLLDLYSIPFLLQLLVDRVQLDGRIPQGRAETFNGFVYTLAHREVLRHNPLFEQGDTLLTVDELELLRGGETPPAKYYLPEEGLLIPSLTVLAHAMQTRAPGGEESAVTIGYTDALKLLPESEHRRDIVRAACDMGVLDRLDRIYIRYYHQLVQEFFAARKLAREPGPDLVRVEWHVERVTPTLQEELDRIGDSDPLPLLAGTGWEETTLMAAAMSANPDGFVRVLMDANLPLAARCAAAPDVNVSDTLCDQIRQALLARTQDPDADLRARIDAGFALGEIGDPRFKREPGPYGVFIRPPTIPIPGGTYTLGSDDGLYEDETPVHSVPVAPFEMGQFPVTNAEYRLFWQAGGYDNEQWWETDAARAWRRGEGTAEGPKQQRREERQFLQQNPDWVDQMLSEQRITSELAMILRWHRDCEDDEFEAALDRRYASGRQTQPDYWDSSAYNHPAQPVVGVSWYEARAYCAWLSAQTGEQYRLPTEAEWEAAARGRQARLFAYPGEFDPARCNTFETHIRRTTPVGVFPGGETPEGLVDMTGNVWDWTSTAYRPYPYRTDDGREDAADARARRVVRGGSWGSFQDLARAAFRSWGYPLSRYLDIGFRVVRVPHL